MGVPGGEGGRWGTEVDRGGQRAGGGEGWVVGETKRDTTQGQSNTETETGLEKKNWKERDKSDAQRKRDTETHKHKAMGWEEESDIPGDLGSNSKNH